MVGFAKMLTVGCTDSISDVIPPTLEQFRSSCYVAKGDEQLGNHGSNVSGRYEWAIASVGHAKDSL